MITICAISYFGSGDIAQYLMSLREQTFESWELVVVDNSESEDEQRKLEYELKGETRARVLRPAQNLGYLGAARWALGHIQMDKLDWLIISNTDVRLADKASLANLAALQSAGVAAIAPSIVSGRDGRDQNPYLAQRPTVGEMRRRARILGNPVLAQIVMLAIALKSRMRRPYSGGRVPQDDRPIYAAHGSFFALSKEFFASGGHLDFPLFLFAEEIFIAEQARNHDLRIMYAPLVKVGHVEHGQMGYLRPIKLLRLGALAAKYGYAVIRGDVRV